MRVWGGVCQGVCEGEGGEDEGVGRSLLGEEEDVGSALGCNVRVKGVCRTGKVVQRGGCV